MGARSSGGTKVIQHQKARKLKISYLLYSLISEPTNFEPHKNPSCIDLDIAAQPSLVLDSGTRDSLDSYCHHKIIHCKFQNSSTTTI